MSVTTHNLPLAETRTPESQPAVADEIARAAASKTAIYPLGGETSLDYGLMPTQSGLGLSLAKLDRVLDYPARDMTVTVEAGIHMADLAALLSRENQWLPLDVPQSSQATLGGVLATAASGPRRYGYGTPRDYVIGLSAIDGRGQEFHAGGRVVKNVAGYDFCKLLTGSLGTLGVITQVSLKVRPRPASSALLAIDLPTLADVERLLAALVTSNTMPVAIELLGGPAWSEHAVLGWLTGGRKYRLVVGLEGTPQEVDWMVAELAREWHVLGYDNERVLVDADAECVWRDLAEFVVLRAALVAKLSVRPSQVTAIVERLLEVDPAVSIAAHAGNGVVIARFATLEPSDVSAQLIGRLQPAAESLGGSCVVVSSTLEGLTRRAVWGGTAESAPWMAKVKQQFDPQGILNPGRFVF